MIGLDPIYVRKVVENALMEDIGSGDITTMFTVHEDAEAVGIFSMKQEGIIAGLDVAEAVFKTLDPSVKMHQMIGDGKRVCSGDDIATVMGKARAILTGERVALNILQRMSGIATLTSKYVEQISHTKARIVDTRKTTPGLRQLEKYSVVVGGGFNHRFGLDDGILIKDNHIAAANGIVSAITTARKYAPHMLKIEVEITSLDQLEDAIKAGADIVLLDNMSLDMMKEAVTIAGGKVLLEASGGVNLDTVKDIAETGVDIISVGALTHSAAALDISLNFTQSV